MCTAILIIGTATTQANQSTGECVIVLHGLGRTEASMDKIEKTLVNNNYLVWNEEYPSREAEIEILAANHLPPGIRQCEEWNADTIHFVTHSMGGILVRQYLQSNKIPRLGKIVMLAPPNHGSEVVDHMMEGSFFQEIMGPAGQQLSTQNNSKPNSLKPIPGIIGIIAGAVTSDPWFAWMFDGPNDGKVSVQSARLDEMADFLVVERGHTFIMKSDDVIEQVLYFLKHGTFKADRSKGGVPEDNNEDVYKFR
jgi:pimeloyl-ACP methyl ester carboxylesterase